MITLFSWLYFLLLYSAQQFSNAYMSVFTSRPTAWYPGKGILFLIMYARSAFIAAMKNEDGYGPFLSFPFRPSECYVHFHFTITFRPLSRTLPRAAPLLACLLTFGTYPKSEWMAGK